MIPETAIAHYSFDDISGATVVDVSGNGFDAMMDNNQSTVPGVVGQGLAFANLDRVIVPKEVLAGHAAFTVEFYMKTTQLGTSRHFVFYYGTTDASPESLTAYVEYANNPTRTPRMLYTGFNSNTVGLVGTTDMGLDVWHHVALIVSQGGMQMFVDHFLEASDPFNPQAGVPGYAWIQIGGSANGFGSFIGVIDELRFSAGALGFNELQPVP